MRIFKKLFVFKEKTRRLFKYSFIGKLFRRGVQAWTFPITNLFFIKIIDTYQIKNHDLFNREKAVYDILIKNKCDWIPKIYYTNNYNIFLFEHVGETINSKNIPEDYKMQITKIIQDLKRLNLKHNDICHYLHPRRHRHKNPNKIEILVKNKKLYLVDFCWASLGEDRSIGTNKIKNINNDICFNDGKGYEWNKDENVILYLDEIYNRKNKNNIKV